MARSTPVEAELGQRIHWLIRLRWIAASAVLYGTFMSTRVLGLNLDALPLYLVGITIAVYNSLFLIALRWSEANLADQYSRACQWMANSQILVDLLFLTLIVHFSGGVENVLAFYFVFHIVIASILLSRRDTFLLATAAIAMFSCLVLGEFSGLLPHQPVFASAWSERARSALLIGTSLLIFASTLYLVAYMATSIVGRLRERDQAILLLNAQLEAKAKELESAYDREVQLEQTKSQYMRKVSHEIRAPMAAIRTTLRVLLDGYVGVVPSAQGEMIARAEKRVQGLLALVGDLLALSRARDLKPTSKQRPVDLLQVVEKVVALQGPRAEAKEVALATMNEGGPANLLADAESMEQLVTNLVANAINYTPNRGRVEVRVKTEPSAVQFQVADTGIGISPAERSRIFDEFYRAPSARSFTEEGTGLGLSIVRSIVETHDGRIDVESELGRGTTFTVALPRAEEARERVEKEVVAQSPVREMGGMAVDRQRRVAPPQGGNSGVSLLSSDISGVHSVDQGGSPMTTGEAAQRGTRAMATASDEGSLESLLALLRQYGPIYGPTRKNDGFVFSPISAAADLALGYDTTVLSPKKFLLRPVEALFYVRRGNGFTVEQPDASNTQVLFGVHSCDLSAIKLLDKVYQQSYVDPVYAARREATLIVAMTCTTPPHDKCFCASMKTGPAPADGYDLLLTDLGDSLLLDIGSEKGKAAVAHLAWDGRVGEALAKKEQLVREATAAMPKALDTTGLPALMNANYDHPYWAKLKDKCLACGNCALSCPSCYCYNVIDQVDLDVASVQRTRTWDACLLPEFAEVHGGNFRKERDARIKQFMYHKLSYWVDQYGTLGCVGCGRCMNACPAGIDITQAAGEIRGEAL